MYPGRTLFWNSYRYDTSIQAVLETVLARHAPDLLVDSVPFGTSSPDHAVLDAETIRRSARWFDEAEFRAFSHRRVQIIDEWLAEMRTHSTIAMLDPAVRVALLADLRSALGDLDKGHVQVEYETRVTATRRR